MRIYSLAAGHCRRNYFTSAPMVLGPFAFTELMPCETTDGLVVAARRGVAELVNSGRVHGQRCIAMFEFSDRTQITLYPEFRSPLAAERAAQAGGQPPSG